MQTLKGKYRIGRELKNKINKYLGKQDGGVKNSWASTGSRDYVIEMNFPLHERDEV